MVFYMVLKAEIPTPVKVLRCFFDNKTRGLTEKEILLILDESKERIKKALNKLSEKGLLRMEGSFYFYVETPASDDLSQKMFKLYDTVKKPPKEQIIQDLVSELFLKPFELERRLSEEGFGSEEIMKIMETEVKKIISMKTTSLEMAHYQYK